MPSGRKRYVTHLFMVPSSSYPQSSIGRKQTVAVTGLLLILFLIGHLAGNLLIFGGPDVYNGYAAAMKKMRPVVVVVEVLLFLIFITHIYTTFLLVMENIKARPHRYRVERAKGDRSLATRLMPYTGAILLAFVLYHLLDFTLVDHDGARGILNGKHYGLYGVVCNAFSDPVHSFLYIIAMATVGFHLSHGVQSFCQTFGLSGTRGAEEKIRRFSNAFAVFIGLGFSSIPVYVLVQNFIH